MPRRGGEGEVTFSMRRPSGPPLFCSPSPPFPARRRLSAKVTFRRFYDAICIKISRCEMVCCGLDHPGLVMLSGYDSELYNDMLTGWDQLQRPAQAANGALRIECLWVNFEIQLRLEF